ncbi:hypothetical protein [Polaribacter sp. Hel1_85]|uniref:hypothetical protein n=1 Tax=Polaribacter sp. Hel1_85 TaxID=1250005 RepID=UPI00052B53E1|nr:hypothetical protein [Polaribacter sp. Hel1_85]KGL64301.1 hypothetical protein PHEL85_1355 [Polaribacter sp. Hel1_85]
MQQLLIYKKRYETTEAIHDFMDFYYSINMKYLASDLLGKGLSPKQITDAVAMAIKVAKSSGIETHKHFLPVFSALNQGIIKDCKLSRLGYGLVLMNADKSLSVVNEFQVDVLKKYLDEPSRFI